MSRKLTKKEALARLKLLAGDKDRELAHFNADGLLLDLIGDKKIRQAFDEIGKWYA